MAESYSRRPGVPRHEPGTEYRTYLHIDDLLELQRPISPGAHDELLFIVVHQAYELWFKLLLHELRRAISELAQARPQRALGSLRRIGRTDGLLLRHLDVLETMSPEGFLQFRDPLAPASGFQSTQFREIERDSGRPLYSAFCTAMRAAGLDAPGGGAEAEHRRRLAALTELYLHHEDDPRHGVLHDVAESLLDHDEQIAVWRHRHMLMAARQIGARAGTGGSHGVAYLEGTLEQRFFPELWAVRTLL